MAFFSKMEMQVVEERPPRPLTSVAAGSGSSQAPAETPCWSFMGLQLWLEEARGHSHVGVPGEAGSPVRLWEAEPETGVLVRVLNLGGLPRAAGEAARAGKEVSCQLVPSFSRVPQEGRLHCKLPQAGGEAFEPPCGVHTPQGCVCCNPSCGVPLGWVGGSP